MPPERRTKARRTEWSRDLVIAEIREIRGGGAVPSQTWVVKHRPDLYGAAQRLLGGWRSALIAAGEVPERVACESRMANAALRTKWTGPAILEEIRRRRLSGSALNVQAMKEAGLATLLRAAKRTFGSYDEALAFAGVEYAGVRLNTLWDTREVILRGIQSLAEAGSDLNISAAQHTRSGLVAAALRYFGTWDEALRAAGFDPEDIRLDVDTEAYKGRAFQNICWELFALLRPSWRTGFRFKANSRVLLPDAYNPEDDEWIDFKLAAWGMSAQSSIRKYGPHAHALRFICLHGERTSVEGITFESVFRYERDGSSPDARALFRRLRELEALRVPATSFDEWATKWTRAEVVRAITRLPEQERHSRHAQQHRKGTYSAAVRLFGGWYQAVAAAGLPVEAIRRRRTPYTHADVNAFIQSRVRRGEALSARAVTSTSQGSGLYQAATRLYGSWSHALAAAGIDYQQVREKPGREVVTPAVLDGFINERLQARASLNAEAIRDGFKAEYGAAFRLYGGWRQAVEASGISYADVSLSTPPRRVTKDEIDRYIRARAAQGLSVTSSAVRADDRPIHTAACRRVYGSWAAALEANGVVAAHRPGLVPAADVGG